MRRTILASPAPQSKSFVSRSKTASLATLTVLLALAACANSPEAHVLPASEAVIPARPTLPMTSDERHER